MLNWLVSKLTGRQASPPRKPAASPPEQTSTRAKPREAVAAAAEPDAGPPPEARAEKHRPTFLERLEEELEPVAALDPKQEAQVSELVCRVVDYLEKSPLDPPAMPALAPRILEAVRNPDMDAQKLARLLEQDQSIGARLLNVANSAAFSPVVEITNLRDAVAYLGLNHVVRVAIALASKALFDPDTRAQIAFDRPRWTRLFHHSTITGFSAASLYAQKYRRQSDQAFLAGLFHDVAKSVALQAITKMQLTGLWDETDPVVTDEVLHRLHAFPGSEFFDRWTLPQHIMDVCAMHHQQQDAEQPSEDFHLICVASSFDALATGSPAERRSALEELKFSAQALRLSDAELRAAQTEVRELGDRVKSMFGRI